jgi:hypothetical protein
MHRLSGPSVVEQMTSTYAYAHHEILSHGPAPRCYRHRRDVSAIVSSSFSSRGVILQYWGILDGQSTDTSTCKIAISSRL